MFDTKLIQLFSRFSAEERRALRKWIVSDFVNKNKDVISFFSFLDSRTAITENTVTKEKAHQYLYPGREYNDLRIRHLIWMTTDVLEDFVAYRSLQEKPSMREQLLAQYYSEKELYKFANQCLEEGMALSEKLPLRDGTYYMNRFRLLAEYYHVNAMNNRSEEFKLQEVIDSAALFTVMETLKYACIIQSMQKISALTIDQHLLEPVLDLLKKPGFMEITPVRIYYHIYQVIREEDEAAFEAFNREIRENNQCFSRADRKDLYLLAINFCIKKSNQNKVYYTRMAFEMYIYAIQEGFLLENSEISRFSFTNIVTLGIKLKEYTKTEQFVKQYAGLITESYRQNTIDFNTAKIYYSKEQHKKALKILLTNEFKDTIWNLNAKYILMKIFLETGDMISFESHLRAFRTYIRRRSNIGYHKAYFTQVLKGLGKLQEISRRPAKFKGYEFPDDTPDIDWFRSALQLLLKKGRTD